MNKKQKKVFIRIIAAVALLAVCSFIPAEDELKMAIYMLPYLIIGYDILIKAAKGIANRQPFDENFLMAVATVGAIALGDYSEGTAVMLFYQIGELFQSYAVGKSRRNISALMDIRPDYANVENDDGTLSKVDPDEVAAGTVIVVRPGEKVPIDGVIIEGKTTLDTAALTGESVPRDADCGQEIISGCINLSGVIRLRTTRAFGESTVSKILDLVENASSKKSKSENFISKFARIYTPAVCFSALALALIPPLAEMVLLNAEAQWNVWVYRALTFLVISCPCALVISIPLSFFAGIGGASKAGILVKGSNYMEAMSKVRTVVFDKTGTMTEGVFEVTGIHLAGEPEDEVQRVQEDRETQGEQEDRHTQEKRETLLAYAALAESFSSHPISRSIQKAYGKSIDQSRVGNLQEISGHGVTAMVDGHRVAAGNDKLMHCLGIDFTPCPQIGTVVHVAIDGMYAGHLLISDRIKKDAKAAVAALKRAGVQNIVMLTGDREEVARQVADTLGIDQAYAQLLPADKVEKMEALLSARSNRKEQIAFVGDGINDAPVLTRADVGIAMGALGSDAAIEAADVVLMDDDPLKIASAIGISRKCLRIVYENIVFAIGVKLICLLLGASGLAGMWAAIFADVGVMIIAVLNAIRALQVKGL